MALNMNVITFIHVECMYHALNKEFSLGFKNAIKSLHSRESIGVCFLSASLLFLSHCPVSQRFLIWGMFLADSIMTFGVC